MESKRDTRDMEAVDREDMERQRVIEAELMADPDNEFLWDMLLGLAA